ncbi:MAG: hypothetical protein HYT08_00490 [Candidatus Levybacteria bacterium]|nr:hypothetical protein [Candidatus Levybacteria bacterium]
MTKDKTTQTAWIFDVDGVITNPQSKIITDFEILNHFIKKLEKGEPVILNTGRSLEWTMDRVINRLLKNIKNIKILKIFLVIGEKGGTWLTFDENGKIQEYIDDSISIPKFLINQIKKSR